MEYTASDIDQAETVYTILKHKNPSEQISIDYNYDTKKYTLKPNGKSSESTDVDLTTRVIYGDSVSSDTPLLVNNEGIISIKSIESIFDTIHCIPYSINKECSSTKMKVWTGKWSSIRRVIRHRCNKKMFRVSTGLGVVDVTEDHSLLDVNMKKIKPENSMGNFLAHSFPDDFEHITYDTCSESEAELFGIFSRSGYIRGETVEFNLNGGEMYLTNLIYNVEKIPCMSNRRELVVHNGNTVAKYRNIFYSKGFKRIPSYVLNFTKKLRMEFINGFFKYSNSFLSYDKEFIQSLYYLILSVGFEVFVYENSSKYIIIMEKVRNGIIRDSRVSDVKILGYTSDFVYDLETETGSFNCGIGQLIVSNTDSIFVKFNYNREDHEMNRLDTFRLAEICGKRITDMFNRNPINLEFEKIFQPFILLTKKRYIGRKYEDSENPFEMKALVNSGIAVTRRDYCSMVKNCYKEVIDCVLNKTKEDAVKTYQAYIQRIYSYEIPHEDLLLSALLKKDYKTRPVHVQLADKLRERNEEVQIGERLSYIFVENTSGVVKKKSELGEDPEYMKKHGLKYNRKCYMEQLSKPLIGFFKAILDEQSMNIVLADTDKFMKKLIREGHLVKNDDDDDDDN